MALRSRRRVKANNEIRAWFKHFVPTSDPENPRTLPLPDAELFKYSSAVPKRRSGRVAARYVHPISTINKSSTQMDSTMNLPDFNTTEIEYQQQLSLQHFDNAVSNDYANYQWNNDHQRADFNEYEYRQESESSESDSDDDDEYIPQGSQRTVSAARAYVQRPPPSQSTTSSSSQVSRGGVTKRKYRLKKDKEREDPDYREMRDKNNEAVERSREKKKRAEREEKEKSEAIREIIKMFMRKEGEVESTRFDNPLTEKQKIVFDEIFHETFSRPTRSRHNAASNRY